VLNLKNLKTVCTTTTTTTTTTTKIRPATVKSKNLKTVLAVLDV